MKETSLSDKKVGTVRSLTKKLNIGDVLFVRNFIEAPVKLFEKPATEEYFDLIEYMLLDYQIETALETRKAAVLSIPHFFDGDENAVDTVKRALEDIDFEQDLKLFLNFLPYGCYFFIVNWKLENSFYKVSSIDPAHPRYFAFDRTTGKPVLRTPLGYKSLPDRRILYFRRNPTPENSWGQSILKACYPMWKLKYETIYQLYLYQDKFANPPVAAIKKEGDIPEDKVEQLTRDLAQLQSGASAFFQGVDEVITINPGNTSDFWTTIEKCDAAISKAITKQTLTMNNAEVGAYSLGKVHQETLESVAILDAQYLARKLNITLIKWILELNNVKGKCEFKFEIPNEADLKDIFEAIDKGLKVPASYLYRRLNVPEPKDGEEVIANTPQPISLSGGKPVNFF